MNANLAIGLGGFCYIYRNQLDGQDVALKVLRERRSGESETLE
jgi:hypothetical protein